MSEKVVFQVANARDGYGDIVNAVIAALYLQAKTVANKRDPLQIIFAYESASTHNVGYGLDTFIDNFLGCSFNEMLYKILIEKGVITPDNVIAPTFYQYSTPEIQADIVDLIQGAHLIICPRSNTPAYAKFCTKSITCYDEYALDFLTLQKYFTALNYAQDPAKVDYILSGLGANEVFVSPLPMALGSQYKHQESIKVLIYTYVHNEDLLATFIEEVFQDAKTKNQNVEIIAPGIKPEGISELNKLLQDKCNDVTFAIQEALISGPQFNAALHAADHAFVTGDQSLIAALTFRAGKKFYYEARFHKLLLALQIRSLITCSVGALVSNGDDYYQIVNVQESIKHTVSLSDVLYQKIFETKPNLLYEDYFKCQYLPSDATKCKDSYPVLAGITKVELQFDPRGGPCIFKFTFAKVIKANIQQAWFGALMGLTDVCRYGVTEGAQGHYIRGIDGLIGLMYEKLVHRECDKYDFVNEWVRRAEVQNAQAAGIASFIDVNSFLKLCDSVIKKLTEVKNIIISATSVVEPGSSERIFATHKEDSELDEAVYLNEKIDKMIFNIENIKKQAANKQQLIERSHQNKRLKPT